MYLNGSLVERVANNGYIYYDGTQSLRIGNWGSGGRYFNGVIDDVSIYNRAITADEAFLMDYTPKAQTITFAYLGIKSTKSSPFKLVAQSNSNLPISFSSSDNSIASIDGDTVTIHKAGTVYITASQGGDNEWLPAESVERALVISRPNNLNDQETENLIIYPTNATDVLTVQSNRPIKQIEFFTLLGQKVKVCSDIDGFVNISELKTGIYMVQIHLEDNSTEVFKILKQ
jgi:hypothetical protein